MNQPRINIPKDKIAEFCHRWKITEFALFGSVLRDDFRPDSDIDVLVTFAADAPWSLFDLGAMSAELKEMLGREVDLVEKAAVKNPFRRRHILNNLQVVYAA
ncbi:DNA polymerase subunit beta [candidate division WOR-3 bacterium JGI_Cruoil_03_51_56]|uniref:DNA polymerase subunit beta n=1 Tax=candidate division WOR-3 bacterium JGI_Cruoil_03_51_56 TaxID=1973747 RepID=A0A235BQY7_UNCW3|nr:MAG: DNA polymerase subunit beta [candidate division WOR-3 bacterium JGI_Cruoil_03_51_56]